MRCGASSRQPRRYSVKLSTQFTACVTSTEFKEVALRGQLSAAEKVLSSQFTTCVTSTIVQILTPAFLMSGGGGAAEAGGRGFFLKRDSILRDSICTLVPVMQVN